MNKEPLVSVIVPIYNNESFLSKCIDSIINQTYTNLEIILVDDGSTDSSSSICDEYALKDCRITVIHKDNGGVSSARNKGLEIIKGTYYSFLDSDDYYLPEFVQTLLDLMINNNSDISFCNFVQDKNSKVFLSYKKSGLFTGAEVISDYLNRKIEIGSCCGKLFITSLFGKIRFKPFMLAEDQCYILECLTKANKVSFTNKELYCYYNNKNSATHAKNPDYYLNGCIATSAIEEYIKKENKYYANDAKCLIVSNAFYCYIKIDMYDGTDEQKDYCLSIIKKNRKNVLFNYNSSLKTRIACLLSFFDMRIVCFIYRVLNRDNYD